MAIIVGDVVYALRVMRRSKGFCFAVLLSTGIIIDDGLVDKARARFEDIVKTYPRTKAAGEARQLLEKLKK